MSESHLRKMYEKNRQTYSEESGEKNYDHIRPGSYVVDLVWIKDGEMPENGKKSAGTTYVVVEVKVVETLASKPSVDYETGAPVKSQDPGTICKVWLGFPLNGKGEPNLPNKKNMERLRSIVAAVASSSIGEVVNVAEMDDDLFWTIVSSGDAYAGSRFRLDVIQYDKYKDYKTSAILD